MPHSWQTVLNVNTITDAVAAATGLEISLIYSASGGTPLTDAVANAASPEISMIAVS